MLADFYSLLCSQARCFEVSAEPLPLCQRCLGLYAGAGLTLAWLAASGLWRRGLPAPGVFALHVALLLAAMAGGLHWIDLGPRWRLACGLWTGHVVVFWLVGGSVDLRRVWRRVSTGIDPAASSAWRWPGTLQALLAPVLLGLVAFGFPVLAGLGWTFWSGLALAGTVVLGLCVAGAVVSGVWIAVKSLRTGWPGGRGVV